MFRWTFASTVSLGFLTFSATAHPQETDNSKAAAVFRKGNEAVRPVSPDTIICEAEEFQVKSPGGKSVGWQARPFGTNYFAATFANAFLSRKAYLGAPEQCEPTEASIEVEIPKAGRYLALIRYESCYRFETQFRLRIEQGGKKLDRLYGARDNLKIWAFREKLKKEVAWSWGAGENVVWEGHDAYVDLAAGKAKLTLSAGKQPTPAAKRNVDLVMLTSDEAQVKMRIEKENYLPLDGMLTQAGDLFVKLHNQSPAPMTLDIPNGTEHSPYWVHIRNWKPITLAAKPGESTGWVEVGQLLDTLSDGQWTLTAKGKALKYALEFGLKDAAGTITTIKKLDNLLESVTLAYDGDTRYTRRIRNADDVLYELVDYLKKQPVAGSPLKRTLFYGGTFTPRPGAAQYNAAIDDFIRLMGATALNRIDEKDIDPAGLVKGYIDVRGVPTDKLEEYCKKLQAAGKAARIATVSLGDEIGLSAPPAKDDAGFRAWLKSKGIAPAEVNPAAGGDWNKVAYSPDPKLAKANPRAYYYSRIYGFRFGIKTLKDRTDILRRYLPNAGIGANFSPHHQHMYLGDTHHWISVFREDGMTMPWGEDYIFQVPVGSQQMNSIMVDMFRASVRDKPNAKIHYYVMPHAPNNTPASWRRQFYGDIAHGVKVFNLFEFRPVQAAYTENHCNSPAMFQEVRKGIHELGKFEDIIQDGTVRLGLAGLWCSETADVWDNHRSPFDAAKRSLYLAIRQQQIPLDFVVDGDDLKGYKALFLADANVSRGGAKRIAAWVAAGGKLIATAGAGMFDEFNEPNKVLRELLGVEQKSLEEAPGAPIVFEKQDLPFAKAIAEFTLGESTVPVFGLRSRIEAKGADKTIKFKDGTPAVTWKKAGKGQATYMAFLPGLTYLKPGLPQRPMDRGSRDDSMTHYIPDKFDDSFGELIADAVADLPVTCSDRLVETTIIQSKQGTIIPLINWKSRDGVGEAIKGLTVRVSLPVSANVSLASGRPVQVSRKDGATVFTFDIDVADVLILR